jgi:hypothetical protein
MSSARAGSFTNGQSSSASTIPTEIIWDRLSERGTAILRQVAIPISNGWTPQEIAKELGTTKRWVLDRMDELRDEISSRNGRRHI